MNFLHCYTEKAKEMSDLGGATPSDNAMLASPPDICHCWAYCGHETHNLFTKSNKVPKIDILCSAEPRSMIIS